MSNKVPQIRFNGYSDDWEERKLLDIADRFDNLRVPITASDRKSGDTPYYGANGIQDYVEGFTHDGEFILVAEDGANDLKNYPIQYVNGKVWVNNHAHVLQGKKTITDNKFLMNSIKNFNIEPFLVGGGRAKLNADVMMKLNILLPTFDEQEQIGSFFSLLDDTIALHQRKLDLLKEQKKGYLQKMFPKNGAKVPELRFSGFADDWEQRKLEELGNLNRGKSKHRPRNDSRLFGGEYPFIQTGDVAKAPLFLTEYSQTYSEFGIQQSKLWDIGTLLITIAANVADTTILGIKAAFPDSVIGFESTSCDVVFIKNYIDIQSDLLKRKAETSSQANLNLAKLKEMNLNVPKLKEQQKIGSFFKQLDDTIALHQHKLDLLKEQKKGFLQKMFV